MLKNPALTFFAVEEVAYWKFHPRIVLFPLTLSIDEPSFFRDQAQVYPLHKVDRGWALGQPEELAPCRAIGIHFSDDIRSSMIYFLAQQEILSFDKETGVMSFVQRLPEEPPDEHLFENWVFQSINKTALAVFERVYNEVQTAHNLNATYLTNSSFVADLLNAKLLAPTGSVKTEVLNLVLDLELPVMEGVSFDRVIDIREKDGEVFQNFRVDLEKKLRTLRQIDDVDKLRTEMENVAHELSEVQVNEVNKKIAKIKRNMVSDAFILVGGLATIIQAEGLGIPVLTYAVTKGLRTYNEYVSDIRDNPAFFLWKIKDGGHT